MATDSTPPPPQEKPNHTTGNSSANDEPRGLRGLVAQATARGLRIFTEVRPSEVLTGLLMTITVFLLLTAYYTMKPVRDGLILEMRSGAEYKSYMSGANAIALLVLVPLYSRLAARIERNRLLVGVTLFFAAHLVLFYLGSQWEALRPHLGLIFYVWLGVFSMMLVAQFWAFANDLYNEEQGKRLFPLIGIGASVGAAVGSQVSALLVQTVGRYPLLLLSAGLLAICAGLFQWIHLREPHSNAPKAPKSPTRQHHAFSMVWNNRYLRLLAVFSVLFTAANSNGEYLLGWLFKQSAQDAVQQGLIQPEAVGDYLSVQFANFYFFVNLFGVLMQALVVSRLVKLTGLRGTFFLLPVIALLGGLCFAVFPLLGVLRIAKIAENATDYSANNTARHLLWVPTSREMKYRAKQAIDTFFVRMGDVGSALIVALGAELLHLEPRAFALINVGLAVVWLVLASKILSENERLTMALDPQPSSPQTALG